MKLKSMLFVLVAAAMATITAGAESVNQLKVSKTTYAANAAKPFIDSGELPGVINIFGKGNLLEIACVGWADVDKKIPMSMDRTFMQCSQTKGFCGVTVAMLVEEGKISLDDPVAKYLPEFQKMQIQIKDKNGKKTRVPAKNAITIRMVMNHTAGFPFEIPTKIKKGWPALSLRDTAKEAASRPLLFEPGTKTQYSNTGIDIGAAVIEVVTGKPWEVFLKERVFDKLGMTDSTFNPTDEQLSRAISMYNVADKKKATYRAFAKSMPLPHNGPAVHPSAGAGLWTTANDQLKFYRMLMNLGVGDNGVRILKEDTVKKYLATSTRAAGLGNYSLGLGADFQKGTMGHGGAYGTSATVNWKKKEVRIRIVQLIGQPRPWNKEMNKEGAKFFSAKINDADTDAYTGRTN